MATLEERIARLEVTERIRIGRIAGARELRATAREKSRTATELLQQLEELQATAKAIHADPQGKFADYESFEAAVADLGEQASALNARIFAAQREADVAWAAVGEYDDEMLAELAAAVGDPHAG